MRNERQESARPLRSLGTLQIKPPSLGGGGAAGVKGHGDSPQPPGAALAFLRVSEHTDDKIRKTPTVIYQAGGGAVVLQCLSLLKKYVNKYHTLGLIECGCRNHLSDRYCYDG